MKNFLYLTLLMITQAFATESIHTLTTISKDGCDEAKSMGIAAVDRFDQATTLDGYRKVVLAHEHINCVRQEDIYVNQIRLKFEILD